MIKKFSFQFDNPSGFARGHGLIAVILMVLIFRITKIVYRVRFHPLAKFPGPKLAAATTAYEFYYNIVKDGLFHRKLIELHEKFGQSKSILRVNKSYGLHIAQAGPVVRIAPNELHFSDPAFHSEIYTGQKSARDKYAPFYRFTVAVQSTFETHDRRLHNSRRLMLMNALSKRSIVAIEPLILRKVNLLAKRLEKAHYRNTLITLDSAFSALTADITSEYGYGRSLGYLDDDDFKNDIRESLLASLTLFHIIRFFPIIMHGAKVLPIKVVQFLNPMLGKVLNLRSLIKNITMEELAKMKQGKPSQAIFVKALNDPSIPVPERNLGRLNDEGFVFMSAGTTAGKTLAFIMFQLLKNDGEIANKLHAELKQAYPDNMDSVTWKDLEAMPYLVSSASVSRCQLSPCLIYRSEEQFMKVCVFL